MRCIDADRLLTDKMKSKYYHLPNGDIAIPLIDIEHAPTIEQERKTGKWIIYTVSMLDGEDCKCSECGKTSCAPYWHYCPNCGAKMEGVEQE